MPHRRSEIRFAAALLGACAMLACASFAPRCAVGAESECVGCHDKVTPQAVMDWRTSRHAQEDIGCEGCHKGNHRSDRDVANLTLVTAQTCGGCHERQMQQFGAGKHAKAWEAASAMPTAHALPMARGAGARGCGSCHKIGLKTDPEIVALKARGSVFGHASCDSCHTRHAFSVLEARQPQACRTCHMGSDHAQWEMYASSKHGVRALLKQSMTLPDNIPAPRCQDCHMPQGSHEVRAAWGYLAVRLPLPNDAEWRMDQETILKALGVLDAAGQPTLRLDTFRDLDVARLSVESFARERNRMLSVCNACHSGSFVKSELQQGDDMVRDADRLLASAIRIVSGLYADGLLPPPSGSMLPLTDPLSARDAPSPIERKLFDMYLEHRTRAIQGSFHMSPDYALWQGWSALVRDLEEIQAMAADLRVRAGASH
jgi:hypothetical protein